MAKITTVLGFDMETDIGSWTSFYEGFGPGTREILRLLDKHGISGTFFFTADSAIKNPDIVKLVRDAGHEIGCHTLFHETIGEPLFEIPGMIPILPEEVEHRIELATQKVAEIAGVQPTSFRCPRLFGSTSVVNALERLGYKADATYPMYFYKEQLRPYHPSKDDWTKKGDLKLIEIPNFADLSMDSKDKYGRDMDQWPLWRTENAEAVMKHIEGYCKYCEDRNVEPFLCFYAHPWEFAKMPEGLIYSGEGAVLPDPFIIKNCGEYSIEQFDRLIGMLKAAGSEFKQACQVSAD
ncbi:MAG: polysaccharide deacetylase family protein [Lentisphaeria bacterium]|nr:polysaccharide deacetylase family protein [Lentisphaeria bacterium]